jgi:hypothetical protein
MIDRFANFILKQKSRTLLGSFHRIGLNKPNIESALIGPYFNFSFADPESKLTDLPMQNFVTCGMKRNIHEAFLVGIVEYLERKVVEENAHNKTLMRNGTSTGVASYPKMFSWAYRLKARESALAEAIERYTWITWWNSSSIVHIQEDLSAILCESDCISIQHSSMPIESLIKITPQVSNMPASLSICIIYGKIKGRGYVSGAAVGYNDAQTFDRAFAELLRHYVAACEVVDHNLSLVNADDYMARLGFMADPSNNYILETRLNAKGTSSIELPKLAIDCELPSARVGKYLYTHKCEFIGMPRFITNDPSIYCL